MARRKTVRESFDVPPDIAHFLNRVQIVVNKAKAISAYDRCKIAVSNPNNPDDLMDIDLGKREIYLPSGEVFVIPQEFIA